MQHGWQALCPEISNQPILVVLLSMTLHGSGTACTTINRRGGASSSIVFSLGSKTDPQIGLETKGNK